MDSMSSRIEEGAQMEDYVEALFFNLINHIDVVYWNKHQRAREQWDDPEIPGMTWNTYYWGDDPVEEAKPNFAFEDVEIRWYKYPGRGMECDTKWSPTEWIEWYRRCCAVISAAEERNQLDEQTSL